MGLARRVLVALGGNAMTDPDGSATADAQRAAIERAVQPVADLIQHGVEVAISHGNGPQVGNLLMQNELAAHAVPPQPLDWCGAQTQATVGFTVQNALEAALIRRGVRRHTATVVTRTLVDPDDPAFAAPTKPIGRYLPRAEAARFVELGQTWSDRGPRGWRRVVASPQPREILDADTVRLLVAAGYVVVAAGGGGIPVVRDPDGSLRGVEAVIDKDLAARLLATALGADTLIIATDVDHVMVHFGQPDQRPLTRVTVAELQKYAAAGEFGAGSMAPKVQAVAEFVATGGRRAVITSLDRISDAVHGRAGTVVLRDAAADPGPGRGSAGERLVR